MIKKILKRKISITILSIILISILYFFPTNKIQTNIKQEKIYSKAIYLKDKQNKVSKSSVPYYEPSEEEIKYLIKVMTINNEYNTFLPSYLKPIIPINTKLINYEIESGLLKLNFTKEFLNIPIQDEASLIESLTYTLTELDGINEIMIYINGEKLKQLPNSKKELPDILDRNIGINNIYEITNIKNTSKITLYYLNIVNDEIYYTPITKMINNDNNNNKIEIIISELKSSEAENPNLIKYLSASVKLENYSILEQEIRLEFNNLIFNQFKEKDISEEARYALTYSIQDSLNCPHIKIISS